MIITVLIISIISLIISIFCLYAIWRLNKYISYIIEDKIEALEDRQDTLEQSVKIALGENLINPNNRIKRPFV